MQLRARVGLLFLALAMCLPGLFALPPQDRDEARFAQASRQMIESGDYINIRFQEEPRAKKPPGAYWAQVAIVESLEFLGLESPAPIWAFRLASVLAVLICVQLMFGFSRRLGQDMHGATICASLLALTLILVSEAHQAKTDALLLATILLAYGGLWEHWQAQQRRNVIPLLASVQFWLGLVLGTLIKGPVAPMVLGLSVLVLCVLSRKWSLLWRLRPWVGALLLLALIGPWALAKGDAFWPFIQQAWREDILPKLTSAQESHGAPPGYYFITALLTLWPVFPLLILGCGQIWRLRGERTTQFLLAWAVPAWLVFELAPTKLPHYTLPLLPALVLLSARATLLNPRMQWGRKNIWFAQLIAVLPPLVLAIGGLAVPVALRTEFPLSSVALCFVALVLAWHLWCLPRQLQHTHSPMQRNGIYVRLCVMIALMYGLVYQGVLPALQPLWLSERVAARIHSQWPDVRAENIASVGFSEPSLVFLLGTDIDIIAPQAIEEWLRARKQPGLILMEAKAVQPETLPAPLRECMANESSTEHGFNYARGKWQTISLCAVSPFKKPASKE